MVFLMGYNNWWFGTWLSFFHILGMSSSQLTNSIIFQRGRAQPPTSLCMGYEYQSVWGWKHENIKNPPLCYPHFFAVWQQRTVQLSSWIRWTPGVWWWLASRLLGSSVCFPLKILRCYWPLVILKTLQKGDIEKLQHYRAARSYVSLLVD